MNCVEAEYRSGMPFGDMPFGGMPFGGMPLGGMPLGGGSCITGGARRNAGPATKMSIWRVASISLI